MRQARFPLLRCWPAHLIVLTVCGAPGAARAADLPGPATTAGPATAPATAQAPAAARPLQRYSLTVRGGVSLGAYEGGINWALLRVLQGDPSASLTTVTGASAGNINAFLSAVEWCQSPARSAAETPRDNLFWKAWIPVGIHGLFPRGQAKGYAPGDGLFARGAFAPAEATLRQALDDGTRFPAGCPLTVGVTVTRIRPADIVIKSSDAQSGGDGIHIPTQRFVSTFGLETGAAGLRFRQLAEHDHEIGEYLTLPTKGGAGLVSDDQVIDIIHASSAFPVAFGPQVIRHCAEDGRVVHGRGGGCAVLADQFIDGGVFDNVPLGLAVSLTGQILGADLSEQVHYVYVDPDHARSYSQAPTPPPERPETKRVGLSTSFDFISTFIAVSEQYELQTVARYLYKPTDGRQANGEKLPPSTPLPRLSSRFHPLMGSYLAHFGAFFAKPFREHDFYVGVYDGFINAAREQWKIDAADRQLTEEEASHLVGSVRAFHDRLGLSAPRSAAASYMVRRLLDAELRQAVSSDVGARLRQQPDAGGGTLDSWLKAREQLPEEESPPRIPFLRVLMDVLACESQAGTKPPGCQASDRPVDAQGLTEVVDHLRVTLAADKVKSDLYFTDADERGFLRRPDKWLQNAEIDAAERLDQIEHIDGYALGEHLTAGAQMVLETEPLRPLTPLDLDPSSIPDRRLTPTRLLFHLLPYEVSGDFVHSGWRVTYRPTFGRESGQLALITPFSPWIWQRSTHQTFQSIGVGLFYAIDSFLLTGVEAFPKVQCLWYAQSCTVGGEVGAYFLAGKLRLGAGVDRFAGAGQLDSWIAQVGIADINGLIYWGVRHAVQ
jgi:predicted acylesterase/phospholipase RssA